MTEEHCSGNLALQQKVAVLDVLKCLIAWIEL